MRGAGAHAQWAGEGSARRAGSRGDKRGGGWARLPPPDWRDRQGAWPGKGVGLHLSEGAAG